MGGGRGIIKIGGNLLMYCMWYINSHTGVFCQVVAYWEVFAFFGEGSESESESESESDPSDSE